MSGPTYSQGPPCTRCMSKEGLIKKRPVQASPLPEGRACAAPTKAITAFFVRNRRTPKMPHARCANDRPCLHSVPWFSQIFPPSVCLKFLKIDGSYPFFQHHCLENLVARRPPLIRNQKAFSSLFSQGARAAAVPAGSAGFFIDHNGKTTARLSIQEKQLKSDFQSS